MTVAKDNGLSIAVEAAGDLSTKRWYFMIYSTGQVTTATAVTDACAGVLQNKPDAQGKAAELVVVGETKVVAGGSITVGDLITTTAAGKAATITPGSDTTKYILGRALETATTDGQVIRAFVNCANPGRGA